MNKLTHTDRQGKAQMVDVGDKPITLRTATASTKVLLNEETFTLVTDNSAKKGDVLTTAKLAGIAAAKRTSELIPLCHQLPLDQVAISFRLKKDQLAIVIEAKTKCSGKTGVEMEALCACSIAALTIYDMLKAVQRDIRITDLRLDQKHGGRSGDYERTDT